MAIRIALATTGKCEHLALGRALRRAFPAADAELGAIDDGPLHSLTSGFVSYPAPAAPYPTRVDALVRSVVATLDRRGGPDFVFAIDDLELPNVATAANVTRLVADGFRRYLARGGGAPTHRDLARLRERCSFHLLCPMVEAYFYGESAALARAGATRAAILAPEPLEAFRTADLVYEAPESAQHHPWRRPIRFSHPKQYLCFLVDPEDTGAREYKESRDGVRALAALDWAAVFAYEPRGAPYAHALFEDLADALGAPNPFPGHAHELTRRRVGGTLRNLA